MSDSLFDRAGESLVNIIHAALSECMQLKNRWVCTEHLLLALAANEDEYDIAHVVLSGSKLDEESVRKEVETVLKGKAETEALHHARKEDADAMPSLDAGDSAMFKPAFSQAAVDALKRAQDISIFYGQPEAEPCHLLLALTDSKNCGALKIFEELSANLTFLQREVAFELAQEAFAIGEFPDLGTTWKDGFEELVERYQASVNSLSELAAQVRHPLLQLPTRAQIVHMVVVGFLSEFLWVQVCFQRFLLEESIHALVQRSGPLPRDLVASIVSAAAQNMRNEVRRIIEHILANEYRLLTNMLDDAEHDVIGSVIEDLWWCQSEEIAMSDMFTDAMQDHRRSHLLDLQKNRIEIAQRMTKLRGQLDDTLKQAFLKSPTSA